MNDETFTPCTKCGRPMAYCKGQCCGKSKGCDCQEYGPMASGCIREVKPGCPYKAVIPTLTVEDKSNLKDLADCFVHVSNINTTFYIDDKHRTIVTWAGPVEYDNYDLDANTLGLRSQFLIDHANDYAAYYNKTGEYQKFNFSEDDDDDDIIIDVEAGDPYDGGWNRAPGSGVMLDDTSDALSEIRVKLEPFWITDDVLTLTNRNTGSVIRAEDVAALLDGGASVVLNGVPLADARYGLDGNIATAHIYGKADGVRIEKRSELDGDGETHSAMVEYGGVALESGAVLVPVSFRKYIPFDEGQDAPVSFVVGVIVTRRYNA